MPIMISMTRFYHNSKLLRRFSSVHSSTSAFFISAVILLLMLSVTSCEEKGTIIGSDLLPKTDFINIVSDTTMGVDAYTLDTVPIVTNSRSYSYLGRLFDPYFGDTRSYFTGQLRLLQPWPNNGPATVDSVKLFFSIVGAKGTVDSTTIRLITLYEISEQLISTVKYYSNMTPNLVYPSIGSFSMGIVPKDSSQNITIRLPNSFGSYLIRDTTKLNQNNDANDFRSFFKGLYLKMEDSSTPLLVALSFSPSNFYITVYYHSPRSNNLAYEFTMSDKSVRYNRYKHEFASATNSAWRQHVVNGTKDTVIYLQAFNGVFPQLRIPGLKAYKNILVDSITKVVHGSINKARLIFTPIIDNTTYTTTTLPSQILLKYTQNDTVKAIVPDYLVSPSFFDGTFNATRKTYSFNLASFVQEYFKGHISEPVVEMYFPEGEFQNVLLRANSGLPKVKFQFTYTRF